MERAREAVEEVAAPAQHLAHASRDRAIRGELAGDDPVDARTRGTGEVDRSVPAFSDYRFVTIQGRRC